MQTNSLHRSISKQVIGMACAPAYWSQFSLSLDLGNNDRTPEITVGSFEGWDG